MIDPNAATSALRNVDRRRGGAGRRIPVAIVGPTLGIAAARRDGTHLVATTLTSVSRLVAMASIGAALVVTVTTGAATAG